MRTVAVFLLLYSSALAQDTVVGPNDIKVGTMLTCPRFSTLYPAANNLIVPAETAQTLPATFDFDVIEVGGTLKLSRTYDTAGKFIVIQVLPGGSLDFGSASDPVLRNVDLQVKDSPLLTGTDGNLGPDPEQFGSGILIFGEWKSYGRQLNKTWTTMQPVAAGATTLTLTDAVNWQVGDNLLLPDTRQLRVRDMSVGFDPGYSPPHFEQPTIAAINGNTVTLTTPLQYDYSLIANEQQPYVANCTRNIVIRSENPNGVRGHTMFMGTAHVNLYYTSFLDLGRTRAETLDSFNANSQHVGTNQIARYGGPHWHHVHGHADAQDKTGRLVGCFGNGSGFAKWFAVQHQTHDLLFTDNVGFNFPGSAFVTEDGPEVRGEWRRNLAVGSLGNGKFGEGFGIAATAPGAEGAGFWFKGPKQTIELNVATNCITGYQFMYNAQVTGRLIPSVPGGENDTPYDPTTALPISFADNRADCNLGAAFESWRQPKGMFVVRFTGRQSGLFGAFPGAGQTSYSDFKDSRFINVGYTGQGLHGSAAYSDSLTFDGGEVKGFATGVGTFHNDVVMRNATIDATRCLAWDDFVVFYGRSATFDNVMFRSPEANPTYIVLGRGITESSDYTGDGPSFTIRNWQGTGVNYYLFQSFANRSLPATVTTNDQWSCPETGLTIGQCFDKYGLAPLGYATPTGSQPLAGVVNAVAFPVEQTPPVPLRAVIQSPISSVPLPADIGPFWLRFQLTNNQEDGALYSVDGGPDSPMLLDNSTARTIPYGWGVGTPGTHSVTTWRTRNGTKQSDTALTFTYTVGEPTTANRPPVVSAITPTPADVDPNTPGVQEYVGPVSYAFTATDQDNDPLTIKVFYSYNGSPRQQYNGPVTSTGWTFNYAQPVNYVWTVQADDGKGGITESSLAVQVINQPTPPQPTTATVRVTLPDGSVYEGQIPKQP